MNRVIIKIKKENNILLKLSSYGINIYNVSQNKDYYVLEVLGSDIAKIPKYIKYKIVKNDTISRIKSFIKRNKINILIFLGGILFFTFITNLTMEVRIIHNDTELRKIIYEELDKYHIKRFTFKKSFNYLKKVKESILEKYKDKIEWLEIDRVGLDYEVKVTERIIPPKVEETSYCHITAQKEGVITKINSSKGEALVHDSSHVNKGDILISGIISFNEQTKGYTCAIGTVYAEVWYTVDVEIPMYEEKKVYTGKKRYNLKYSRGNVDYKIFKSRLENYEEKEHKIISLLGNEFYLEEEIEYKIHKEKLTEEQALIKADSLIAEKINLRLENKERILYKKVLKKSISGSKMVIEAFVATEEQIGVSTPYEIPKEGE